MLRPLTRAIVVATAAVVTALLVAPTSARAATTTVGVGFRLQPGQALTSSTGNTRLVMQGDGNLVLYTERSVALWNSRTSGRGSSVMSLQSDGNLVVRTVAGAVPTWSSRTTGGAALSVQDDGNVVLRKGSTMLWCTCALSFGRVSTRPASLAAGQGMLVGDALVAGDKALSLQSDGNLVLRGPNGPTWSTGTTTGGARTSMSLQGDGNLVVRGAANQPLWNSKTAGSAARVLKVGTDGSLELLSPTGVLVWGVGTGATPTGIAADVFALLNRQRAAHGLAALTSDPRLIAAAARHNAAMSAANTLSHQLPGEPDAGARMAAAGYSWRAWAENIAWTTQTTSAGAQALQTSMYDETPPNDGHRRNILSTSVTQVGVAVLVDSRGKLWLTTDFGAPR